MIDKIILWNMKKHILGAIIAHNLFCRLIFVSEPSSLTLTNLLKMLFVEA